MILSLCPNPSIDTFAWLDNFHPGKVNRIKKLKEYPGGKGVHVAIALAELGKDSNLFGNWAGNAGVWIKNACLQKKISISGPEVPGNNRKCYTFRSATPSFDNSELLEPGPELTAKDWEEIMTSFKNTAFQASLICMSGSWPKNAPEDAYLQLIKIANSLNTKVILDCSGKQLREALQTNFFGLHINEHEAKEFCGSTKMNILLKKLQGKVKLVALTKGKEGVELFYKGQIVKAKVEIPKVISTVGSGDCLTAGIAFAVDEKYEVEKIAAYAVACGAANCLTEDLGMLSKENVQQLLPQVEITKEYEI